MGEQRLMKVIDGEAVEVIKVPGVVSVRMQPELREELADYAEDEERSLSWVVNQAVKGFLAHRDYLTQAKEFEKLVSYLMAEWGDCIEGESATEMTIRLLKGLREGLELLEVQAASLDYTEELVAQLIEPGVATMTNLAKRIILNGVPMFVDREWLTYEDILIVSGLTGLPTVTVSYPPATHRAPVLLARGQRVQVEEGLVITAVHTDQA